MALNVTTAVIADGSNTATASPSLAQWDQGQILQISGVDLPDSYQVEFSTAYTRNAIPQIGDADGVAIPNVLLQRSAPITAYVVLHEDESDRETEYWITIHITPRTPPETTDPDPEEMDIIDQTIAALQAGVTKAEAAAEAVEDLGVEAETLAPGSEATVEKTVDAETGAVTLTFGIPQGETGDTGATGAKGDKGDTGAKGDKGDKGDTGETGNGIASIVKTGTSGLTDTYTITFTDGTTTTYTVTNGAKGDKGDKGDKGNTGDTGNGIASVTKTGTSGAVDTYTIAYTDGTTTTYTVTNGSVTSVNTQTGAVVLDAGDLEYDDTETYSSGTVGEAVSELKSQISVLESRLKSGDEEDAELHLGFYLDANGDLCQVDDD